MVGTSGHLRCVKADEFEDAVTEDLPDTLLVSDI
jgi:hypothetical protein